jgi:hypothetical protein
MVAETEPQARRRHRPPARMTPRGAALCMVAAVCAVAAGSVSFAAPVKPAREVRARIVSGTPQSAHAYVAPAAPKYVTEFARPLVVRVEGARNPKLGVRFFCVTPGCELPPQVQPDEVKRIDPRTFEVQSKDGKATISLTVSTDTPRTVEVVAEPLAGPGERAVRSAPFRLTER